MSTTTEATQVIFDLVDEVRREQEKQVETIGRVASIHMSIAYYTSTDNRAVYSNLKTAKLAECPRGSNCAQFGDCDHVCEILRCTECDPIDPYATFIYGTYPCRTAEALEGAL